MANHATRYTLMPIPPIKEHTSYFEAGTISFGVEYRLLNNEIVNQHMTQQDQRIDIGDNIDDRGVSLHVFGAQDDGQRLELLQQLASPCQFSVSGVRTLQ